MAKKTKIDYQAVLTAAASGAIYTLVTNAVSKTSGKFAQKWNENKDEYYSLGALALGTGLLYFVPGKKWTNAAGYGLIGAGGAIAAQVVSGAVSPTRSVESSDGLINGLVRKFTGKPKADSRKLLNRVYATRPSKGMLPMGAKPGRVTPNNYSAITNCEVLGLN
jgi:hypothetical protein